VLRRTQDDIKNLNPRLALPALQTSVIRLEFGSKQERLFYNTIEEYFREKAMEKGGDVMTSLTRCRQACTNPSVYMKAIGSGKAMKKAPQWDPAIGCTKLTYLIDDLKKHVAHEKCLVFCMWTEELSSLAELCKQEDIATLIYDGNMSRDNKDAALYNFKHTDIQVLLIQINCGATGLNLQCASRVYITSPNWNPCIELQAIGRAYRKGQTRNVTCLRLVMVSTVEERCIEIQESKMKVISDAMSDTSFSLRLGAIDSLDDININDIFTRKRRRYVMDDDDIGDAELEICEEMHHEGQHGRQHQVQQVEGASNPESNKENDKDDLTLPTTQLPNETLDGALDDVFDGITDDDDFMRFLDSLLDMS
jgi:SNF2 family DNA or RNA helicase